MLESRAHRKLEYHRIILRRFGSGTVFLVPVWLTGCSAPGTDTANLPLNIRGTSTSSELGTLPPMTIFRIGGAGYGPVRDCRVDGAAVTGHDATEPNCRW